MNTPLAERLRPREMSDVVGQDHILGEKGPLKRLLSSGKLTNMIFYGPSGVGKTTVANLVAGVAGLPFRKLNATTAAGKDIKEVLSETQGLDGMNGIVLYLDEIQYLNKKQQQTLLEYIEDGRVTLIASTTENPYFYVYKAILSRCAVFEFKPISPEAVEKNLFRGLDFLNEENGISKGADREAMKKIALYSGGDVRASLNFLELCYYVSDETITPEDVESCAQRNYTAYDRSGDDKYELLSALQKSIRGSDENAAIFYLAKLLEAGDLQGACRRLLVIASEDIGLAYPQAICVVKSCVDSALMVGMPEARIPLAEAAVFLATLPKSNSAYMAYSAAAADIAAGLGADMPSRLKNNHFFGVGEKKAAYLYPHDYPDHWVSQQYLPDDIKDKRYYSFGENKTEMAAKAYWEKIKNKK
ncbi:MAG: replication-associated recombination protein A [Clostridia bacterium]|nr:replication-associated recombination protein A [Clostridia bacterium]